MSANQKTPEEEVSTQAPWTADGVEVTSLQAIVNDGWYNQATDLVRWKNFYWLGYRRGTKHGPQWGLEHGANSFGVILRSNDLHRWHEAKVFEPPEGVVGGSGVNCPRFVPVDDRLYVFFTVHTPKEEGVFARTIHSWTADGVNWSEPVLCRMGDNLPFLWRVRHRNGRFNSATCYLNRPGPEDGPLDLLLSTDGENWTKHAKISHPNDFTEEMDLHWLPDGDMWCLVRTLGSAWLYTAKSPYTNWDEGMNLGVWCHAPAFCSCDGEVYVAGRHDLPEGATTGVFHITRSTATLIAAFDPAEDTSYSGLISPEPGKLIVSFYSDGPYAKKGAKLKFFGEYKRKYSQSDIFLAELDVSGMK